MNDTNSNEDLMEKIKEIFESTFSPLGFESYPQSRSPNGKGYATDFDLKAIHSSLLILLSNLSSID